MLTKLFSVGAVLLSLVQLSTGVPINAVSANDTETLLANKRWHEGDIYDLQDVLIGCNDIGCTQNKTTVDAATRVAQTCPRRALAAKANFFAFCSSTWIDKPGFCNVGLDEDRFPSIGYCCGKWVHTADSFTMGYPTMAYENGTAVPTKTGAEIFKWAPRMDYVESDDIIREHSDWIFRKVIKPYSHEFNSRLKLCAKWVPETEGAFQYFMQNLLLYGIDERKETVASNVEGVGPPADA
jgi:hypothetical protein